MSLGDLLDKPNPISWRPGDAPSEEYDNCNPIFGTFQRLETGMARGKESHIAVLEKTDAEGNPTGEGERSIWLFHRVLRDRLKEMKPTQGQLIAIRRDGTQPSKVAGNNDMVLYTVKTPAVTGTEANWDSVGRADGPDNPSAVDPTQPVHVVYDAPAAAQTEDDSIPFVQIDSYGTVPAHVERFDPWRR